MNLPTLRERITAAIGGLIGVYTLANGATTPAISARRDGDPMTPGTTVTGLEVVMLAEPRPVPISQYSNQQALLEWLVFLVGWDETADPQTAALILVDAFPGSEWERILVPQGVGPSSQARVTIRSDAAQAVAYLSTGAGDFAVSGQDAAPVVGP
jgi:hypothetical protein